MCRKESEDLRSLIDFVSSDKERAEQAFSKLMSRTKPMLHAHLSHSVRSFDDREDIISEVVQRLWGVRARFAPIGMAAWWQFVKRTADWCRNDYLAAKHRQALDAGPLIQKVPNEDLERLEEVLDLLNDRARLRRLADEVWLGEQRVDHHRRLLAAKLFYIDGRPWEQVLAILGGGVAGRRGLNRRDLDEILGDGTIIRYVAYSVLYVDNQALTAHVLGLDPADGEALRQKAIESLEREGAPPGTWTWEETYVILRRYLHNLLLDQILVLPECELSKKDLRTIFDKCTQLFPFVKRMRSLLAKMDRLPHAKAALASRGLWRRLVLQYHSADALAHRDILDRVSPPAECVEFRLTLGMLNVWLSNNRLQEILVKRHLEQSG